MYGLILLLHVIIAAVLIGLVLLQRGKGASMGAAFGSGASQTVFGSQGSSSFLLKLTGILAAVFFATTLGLGYIISARYHASQGLALPTSLTQAQTQETGSLPQALISPEENATPAAEQASNNGQEMSDQAEVVE